MAPAPPATGTLPPEATGPAHVAVVSFLAARAAPTGGFWVALAGGVALARLAERRGARVGFGASAAAMLETVAIIGPARFGVPLTQALSAPMLGRLHARGVGFWRSFLACAAVRLVHNAATTAFFVWVIAGGLDAYAGTYDAIGRRVGLEVGTADALVLTMLSLLAWAAFASTVQVLVYRRGLRSWPADDSTQEHPSRPRWMTNVADSATFVIQLGRFDPRAVALAALVAFVLLLSGTEWSLLGAVAGWLLVVWLLARGDREPLAAGAVFAGVLALGAFAFALGGGLGLELALRRATRAALLVLAATWLRSAAGVGGLREVFHRVLDRLRRVPAAPEARAVLDAIASERRLAESARSLAQLVREAPKRPRELLDAVLGWVRREAGAYRAAPPAPSLRLHARAADLALVASALAPALALTLD
jgi:hypothetical protein